MLQARRETVLLLVGDVALLVCSLWLALALRNLEIPAPGYFFHHFIAFTSVFALSIVVFFIAGLYEKQTRLVKRIMGARIIGAQLANTLIAIILFFFLPFSIAPKTILALYLLASILMITLWRFWAIPRFGVSAPQKAVLVGTGAAMHELHEEVNHNNRYKIRFVEHIDPVQDTGSVPGRLHQLVEEGVRIIVIDTRQPNVAEFLPRMYESVLEGATFIEFSAFYESLFDRVPLEHVDHAWLLECLPNKHPIYSFCKRTFDIVGALLGLVVSSVLLAPAALAVWFTGGNPFILHDRIGRNGVTFRIIKLRTMLFNDHGDPELQAKNRVTRIGAFLRKSRIDELPQLINVLAGDLSFIGPRPELPTIGAVYTEQIPYYDARHLITPGLSGWAQIKDTDAPRGAADVGRTTRKLSYDLFYLKHQSFMLDILIALKTLRALASFSGK